MTVEREGLKGCEGPKWSTDAGPHEMGSAEENAGCVARRLFSFSFPASLAA